MLASKIPGSSISFLTKSTSHRTEFDFAWRASDNAGRVAAILRDTLPVKLNPENYQQVLSSNFLYEGGFVLPPGKYKLKAVVRENESGKMGTFEEPLVLPQIGQSGLALSSVIVSNELQGVQQVAVVGQTTAQKLFGDESPVGQTVRVLNVPFKIIGLLTPKGFSVKGHDQDNVLIVPYTSAMQRLVGSNAALYAINVKARDRSQVEYVRAEIADLLRQRRQPVANPRARGDCHALAIPAYGYGRANVPHRTDVDLVQGAAAPRAATCAARSASRGGMVE